MGKYFRIIMGGAEFLSQNNYTTVKISGKDGTGNWSQIMNFTYQIEYNSNQLPTQVMVKLDNNDYAKYTYEYITPVKQGSPFWRVFYELIPAIRSYSSLQPTPASYPPTLPLMLRVNAAIGAGRR